MNFAYGYNPLLLNRVLRRDRAIICITLLILILLAWLYVLRLAAGMDMTGTRMVSAGSRMVMTSNSSPGVVPSSPSCFSRGRS